MSKVFSVAIIGVGSRGADAYGAILNKKRDKFNIVSICDVRSERIDRFAKLFEVDKDGIFLDEKEFFKEKRADLLIIATQDADHYRHMMKAFELGYDVLCEKPITDKEEECLKLLETQKKYNVKAIICHVLRYSPLYRKIYDVINSGILGKIIGINALEGVTYWHQAHSYVRGNWRRVESSTPMILAKCCHDLDLLQWFAGAACKTVSSIGNLSYFKIENAPENSAEKCVDCRLIDECPYSAKRVYIDGWNWVKQPEDVWPYNVIASAPLTEEKLYDAIKHGPYGKCAFRCDNNVVDNQIVMMEFENGVKAELTMTAFSSGRRYHIYGSLGEIILANDSINVIIFGNCEKSYTLKFDELIEKGHSHGGGDERMMDSLYDILCDNTAADTSLTASIESHLIGINAEKSRILGGIQIKVHK